VHDINHSAIPTPIENQACLRCHKMRSVWNPEKKANGAVSLDQSPTFIEMKMVIRAQRGSIGCFFTTRVCI
jgi:hypothetical protein